MPEGQRVTESEKWGQVGKKEFQAGLDPCSVEKLEGHCEGTQWVVRTVADTNGFGGQVKNFGYALQGDEKSLSDLR